MATHKNHKGKGKKNGGMMKRGEMKHKMPGGQMMSDKEMAAHKKKMMK